jgi:hypothetical protein
MAVISSTFSSIAERIIAVEQDKITLSSVNLELTYDSLTYKNNGGPPTFWQLPSMYTVDQIDNVDRYIKIDYRFR